MVGSSCRSTQLVMRAYATLLANVSGGLPSTEPERIKSIRNYPTKYRLSLTIFLAKFNVEFLRACLAFRARICAVRTPCLPCAASAGFSLDYSEA